MEVQRVDLTIALPERAEYAFDLAQRAIAGGLHHRRSPKRNWNKMPVMRRQHRFDAQAIADETITRATQRAAPVLAELGAVSDQNTSFVAATSLPHGYR